MSAEGETPTSRGSDLSGAPHTQPAQPLPLAPTPLVGREQEVAALAQRLRRDDVRLVTLTGPPGIGKTRLSVAVAATLFSDFPHSVHFVDLAPVADPSLVLPTIAHVLGLQENAARPLLAELQEVLAGRRLLLLIDNFEQVVQAAPALSDLLQAAPTVKLLVTSRELLHISGEQNVPVPPLPLPPVLVDQGAPRTLASVAPERLGEFAAVQLFVQRAQAMQPDFALTPENALTVAGICCRLDGLPLAIELAAARIRHIPPPTIYERLERRLHVLTGGARDLPPRQRTLRTAIEWSDALLDEGERALLARLAVFRGGCSLEAVEAVCAEGLPIEALDGLASLIDKSLVARKISTEGAARFVLLEMIAEFAREQLAARGETAALRARHAAYVVALAERAGPELRRANQRHWFHLLEGEIDNLRAALAWSLENDLSAGVRIMSAIMLYWRLFGRQDEGIRWTQQMIERIDTIEPLLQVRLLRNSAILTSFQSSEAAIALSHRAVALARAVGDKAELGWALWTLGANPSGEPKIGVLSEAQVLFEELDDPLGLAHVLNGRGEKARIAGQDSEARRAYAAALVLAERIGDIRMQYTVLYNMAFIAQHEGDHHEALRLLRRSLALCQEVGIPAELARELLSLAGSLGATGDPVGAARLFGAAEAYFRRSGARVHPDDQSEHDRNITLVRERCGEAAFAAAWAAGQALTIDEAAAYVGAASDLDAPPPQLFAGLTRREQEIALLVAAGKSNREIADALVVTERTAEWHVSNILAKLELRSRGQLSAWVAAHAPPGD